VALVLPRTPVPSTSPAENKLRLAFADLDADWIVLHSVSWQSPDSRRADGEADFVLLHRDHGLLVVEVKGGGVRLENGRWYSVDRHGEEHEIKNPYDQAVASKHALVAFLRMHLDHRFIPSGHVVALPDIITPELGPAGARAITWDRDALSSIRTAVRETVAHYSLSGSLDRADVERISSLLLPSVTLKPLLRDEIEVAEKSLARLTAQQIEALEGLRRNRRAVIYGGAGTGKSLLAVHRAVRLAEQGFDVLLTCFNEPLSVALARQVRGNDRVTVRTFHKLCADESRRAGLNAEGTGREWWDRDLPSQLPQAASANETQFDAIVVDEAQDFDPGWWVALQLLLRNPDEGPFYAFADTQQAIYRRGWEPPFEGFSWELTVNCRNTAPITAAVASVFATPIKSLKVDGPAPVFRCVDSFESIGEALRRALHRLVSVERLAPHDIAVLSSSKTVIDVCRARRFGNLSMGPAAPGQITAETVHRFKGLESAAVILVIPPGEFVDPALMYVALSRARSYLEVVAERSIVERLEVALR
jgi:hypothetical protein